MNFVEKILARASGRRRVEPGEVVVAEVDRALFHDLSGYITGNVYEERVGLPVRHPDRIVLVFDHTFSPPTEEQARVLEWNREFAARHGLRLYDCGSGNLHNVATWEGLIRPGAVVVGSDSHTPVHGVVGSFATGIGNDCHAGMVLPYGKAWFQVPHTVRIELTGEPPPGTTPRDVALWLLGQIGEGGANYLALEFAGDYVRALGFWDRWLLPLIAVDVGAKCGYMEPDDVVTALIGSLTGADVDVELGDPGSAAEVWRFDVSQVVPQIACPPSVGNVRPVSDLTGTPINWAELGGHGGGRLADIEAAATIMSESPKREEVRFNIVPSSRVVFSQAVAAGLVGSLHESGATWFPPSTGSNQAVNMGAMTENEAMISTHARNFPGRNGHPKARMYLASASTVAASAVTGKITDPRTLT